MGGDYADSGNAAVVFLTEGDTVYIQSRDQYDVSLYGAPDEIYSTITGTFIGESTQGNTKVYYHYMYFGLLCMLLVKFVFTFKCAFIRKNMSKCHAVLTLFRVNVLSMI